MKLGTTVCALTAAVMMAMPILSAPAPKSPNLVVIMVAKWKAISADVLHSEELATATTKPSELPRTNDRWTLYSDAHTPPVRKPKKKQK